MGAAEHGRPGTLSSAISRVRGLLSNQPPVSYAAAFALTAVVYYVAGELGLSISLVGRSVTPLWPPTGVAVVAMLLFGRRLWPAIAVAAFAINLPISPSPWVALLIAVGNVVAPLVAVTLLKGVGFRVTLERVRDVAALVLLGAIVSMAISATVGSLALLWSGAITRNGFAGTWSVWWTGDAMGVLIVAPFLWSLSIPATRRVFRERAWEIVAIVALLGVACTVALWSTTSALFVLVPVVGLVAWRFGQRGVAPANLVVSVAATIAAANSVGPFQGMTLLRRMVTLQSFNATVVFTSLLLAAAVAQRQRMAEQEHEAVETLQHSLLPDALTEIPGLACAARYIPASADVELGGDWYDIIALPDRRFAFVVGDVAGHGVPAAALMGQVRMALRAYALVDMSPAEMLGRLNELLRELQPGAMVTLWYGQFDPATYMMTFANAGHVPPLVIGGDGARFVREVHGPPIGVVEHVAYAQSTQTIGPDVTLLLYTDGLIERRGASIDEGLDALRDAVPRDEEDVESLCAAVVERLVGPAPADDIAVLALRPQSLSGRNLRVRCPARLASVPETRHLLRAWLTDNGVRDPDAYDILVATSEACANAITHAYRFAPGPLEVEACIDETTLSIVVRDEGRWRPRSDNGRNGGRGLEIMRALMDDVDIDSRATGTRIAMRRELQLANRPN